MKITKKQLSKIVKEEMKRLLKEGGDPVGPQEAHEVAKLLQNLGFTLTRGGLNSLTDFMQGLEQGGDLYASPETRRGALTEYTPRETADRHMPYAGPEDMEEEIAMLQQTRDTIKAVRLPAPMDGRIMEAVEYMDKAIKALIQDHS